MHRPDLCWRCQPCSAPQTEEANQGSFPATKAGLQRVERPVVGWRTLVNGGAVSSDAGGRKSADQWKQEGEEEADDETDFSARQEAYAIRPATLQKKRGSLSNELYYIGDERLPPSLRHRGTETSRVDPRSRLRWRLPSDGTKERVDAHEL
ncbi:hypothetical protein NDU88_004165 [Pleurodeles waltl]|uniref:Uncharacterized protein n=1 Tax=Pleurodeles waltl TaxID=8319 RepID=A0AAV7VHY5_PLEWA|nr:hypothetical protein NDU88_004165 [Pleurodeles waltl]